MKALWSLLLLLGLAWVIDRYALSGAELSTSPSIRTAMNVGLLMLGAWVTGVVFNRIHLPRVSGYLIYGVIVGPYVAGLVAADQLPGLRFISDLAIALIALTAGGEIDLQWLRGQMRSVCKITFVEMLSVWILMTAAVFTAVQYVPLIQDASTAQQVVMAVLVGLVMVSNSPAIVIAMINEYNAHGPLARTTLAVTIFKDMLMVVVFTATLAVSRGVAQEQTAISAGFLAAVAVQLVGSLALGAVLGAVMAFYVHKINAHMAFFLIGSCMLLALIGEQHFHVAGESAHLEPLLLGLAAGLVMRNLWEEQTEPLFETVEHMSLPVYCLFFALAGAKINMSVLASVGAVVVVIGLFLIRGAAVWASVSLAARWAGYEPPVRSRMWMGFIPQAGVSLALAMLIQSAFREPAHVQVENILIGIIALSELIGPVGFRFALLSTGEAQSAPQPIPPAAVPQQV